ncbi:MAG: DsbA family protein [Sulfuritalea sp.]|nr:DsbA family protein [Sulfuritalea sp.]
MNNLRIAAFTALAALFFSATCANAQSAASAISSEQRKATEQIVHDYLLKNPAIIRDALQALQAQEEKAKQKRVIRALKKSTAQLYKDASSPVGGNPKGDVTIVEFFDYNCGYCKRAASALSELVSKDPDVRVIYKEFPILGPQSLVAARAALAAHRQGKYVAFHEGLMAQDQADDAAIKALAEKVGLDYARLEKDMTDPVLMQIVERNYALATDLQISGTPAFIIGERLMPGALELNALAQIVSAERARNKVGGTKK